MSADPLDQEHKQRLLERTSEAPRQGVDVFWICSSCAGELPSPYCYDCARLSRDRRLREQQLPEPMPGKEWAFVTADEGWRSDPSNYATPAAFANGYRKGFNDARKRVPKKGSQTAS